MAELEKLEPTLENAGISNWQMGLANAINDTYSYANNSLFYAIVPSYYRDYAWRYVRPACQWLDGYVWSLHQESGIISTRIASKLMTGVTKQVVGEKLLFKSQAVNENEARNTLQFVSKWAKEQDILKAIYGAIGFALGIGTSMIKLNQTSEGQVWWEAVRFDNCFYTSSFKNEVSDATFCIRTYVDTNPKSGTQQFYLVEHRYYDVYTKPEIEKYTKEDGTVSYRTLHKKGDKVAMTEYQVYRITGTVQNNLMPTNIGKSTVKWDELPKSIKEMIKNDYRVIKIGCPQRLGFPDLGVYPLLNGNMDLSVPTGTNFGESLIVGIQDDLTLYEVAQSYLLRDMYNGKGTVYVPKSLNMTDVLPQTKNSMFTGIGDTKYELVKGVDPESQKIIVQQFELRGEEWEKIKENCLKSIAVKWGMSPKVLASFLAQAQATATQIDSEDDMSIAFISHTRAYFKNAINKALETTLNFYGYPTNVEIDFASPSLLNKDRLIERTIKLLEAGLIDEEDAIRTINPDLDEDSLKNKIATAKRLRDELKKQQEQQLNSFGELDDFTEDNEEDLGGVNLKGSTSPNQNKDLL